MPLSHSSPFARSVCILLYSYVATLNGQVIFIVFLLDSLILDNLFTMSCHPSHTEETPDVMR